MVNVDMTQPDRKLVPGIDLWEIKEAADEKSSKGDGMLSLKLFRVSNPSDHIYDNIMLAGAGWPVGKKKLGALLPPNYKGNLDPLGLIGVRLWVSTGVEAYKGQDRLRVLIADLKFAGLQPAADVPPGCALPAEAEAGADASPF